MSIDIVKINKAELLLALYKRATPYQPNGVRSLLAEIFAAGKPPTRESVAREIAVRSRTGDFNFTIVNLGEGPKELWVRLDGPQLNPTAFDKLYGEGAALSCVQQCQSRNTPAHLTLFQQRIKTRMHDMGKELQRTLTLKARF